MLLQAPLYTVFAMFWARNLILNKGYDYLLMYVEVFPLHINKKKCKVSAFTNVQRLI